VWTEVGLQEFDLLASRLFSEMRKNYGGASRTYSSNIVEFDSGIDGGELPLNLDLLFIPF